MFPEGSRRSRQTLAQSSATSRFMWMKRPGSRILKAAKVTRVAPTNPTKM